MPHPIRQVQRKSLLRQADERAEADMQKNILEYLEATAPRLPDKIAYSDGTDDMTFSELLHTGRGIGTKLLQQGFCGEAVAVLMEKHPRQIACFYGTIYAGCYYVAIDPEMPTRRMEMILANIGARVMLVDKSCEKKLEQLDFNGTVLLYDDIADTEPCESLLKNVRERQIDTDPIYIVFTSGSTGIPKGVAACHRSVIDYVEALCAALHFSQESIFANQTPLFFDAPLKELMPVIKYGATAYLVPKKLFLFPMALCDFLNEHRVNTVCWVVSALTMISSLGALEKNPPKYLKTVAFGSEVFPRKQYDLWRAALPDASFYNLYGPTEATGMSCYWRADRALDADEPIPIGRPFPNTDLFLINQEGRRSADGEEGEIYLRGTCVTLGYFNNPEKTAEAFVQNPLQSAYPEIVYRTGDLARVNAHGELVFISRRDAQIKHMGHRIELGEIEAAASECKGIYRVCCVYDSEEKRILLYYTGECEPNSLLSELRSYLPRYMLPANCKKLEHMPLTPNGKIDRKGLAVAHKA